MIRTFDTGATRSPLADKPQYEGYLNPLVIKRFGEYMLKHQTQADGQRREPDNWQKGIPPESLMDSKMRHDLDVRLHHRGYHTAAVEPMEEALCGVLFNTMALLLHTLTISRPPVGCSCPDIDQIDLQCPLHGCDPPTKQAGITFCSFQGREPHFIGTMDGCPLCQSHRTNG